MRFSTHKVYNFWLQSLLVEQNSRVSKCLVRKCTNIYDSSCENKQIEKAKFQTSRVTTASQGGTQRLLRVVSELKN